MKRSTGICAKAFVAGLLALAAQLSFADSAPAAADTIYLNARIYTVNPDQPWAEAVAIRGGHFVHVGDRAGAETYRGPATIVVDLQGSMVMPGINDAHVHAQRGGVKSLYECNFPFSSTPEQIARRVAECVAENPDLLWIRGGQWDSGFFDTHDIESPRAFLDAVSGDKAVLLNDDSNHNGWVNSRALALAGIDRDTPDPSDGTIVRDPVTGEPNGLLLEGAEQRVSDQLPEWSQAELQAGAREALRIANSFGITGLKEAYSEPHAMAAFQTLEAADALTAHLALGIQTPYGHRTGPLDYAAIDQQRDRYASDGLHTAFVKVFMDGVPTASRTAAMLAPYTSEHAHAEPNRGMLHLDPDVLTRDVIELDKRGYTVKIHTAGDRSVRVALDAIAAAREANGNSGLRHELAHAGYIDPEDLPRFAQLDAVADLSPYLWHPSPIIDSVVAAVGSPRGEQYFPVRSLLEAKAPILAGSDWPAAVETIDPWLGIEALVTRQDPRGNFPGSFWPEQGISLGDALQIMTLGGARAMRLEQTTGSIEVGKSADMIVLDRDLFAIEPQQISEVRVLRTLFAGNTVYITSGEEE
ncbi:MAG: amidohydrolase [Haliea sp.]|uniref:amidohydrolase n=1 Tax=Haliea sp. TaxID=1932666 RepID=UPI0032EF908B